ncbi:MAG: lysophospholipid acyltransferase family protein [Deltaproteobacteria bacterium]|nr:lysophospholipid acyltransferase family protein [Deltaproteobacteria bacterium]MBN2687705.1 lysophospholipid acyltransferase family protein [Deltaproteobacteria bacterium]
MKKTLSTRIILLSFGLIPLRVRVFLFRALFFLFYHVSEKHRIITVHNLVRAFPEKNLSEIIGIAKNVYRNMGTVAAEFFEIPNLTVENMSNWVTFEGLENYEKARAKKKGILFYTGHFGNWELLAACFGLKNMRVTIVYRALDNPVLENFVAWFRSFTGHKVIPKGGAFQRIVELLGCNEMIGILIDQNVAWKEGVFVDFLGRPASTTRRFADLALKTGAPVVSAFIIRQENGRYRIVINKEIEVSRTGVYERDIFDTTQNFTRVIEDMVRQYPDQYFWIHQRWKTKKSQIET